MPKACATRDALHRNTSVTYSGSYAGVTPNKYFVYDSATVNGVSMANAKGHLAEAYTCTTCPGTKLTDEGFSYTVRGEISDVYQTTPHTSPNYYHVAQTYWPHGIPSQLSATYNGSAITGLPTITYGGTIGSTVGIDGQGRITQVTASSGQNPITAMNYNSYATPPQVTATLGSSDTDVFSFDANTGLMTKYQFNINGQSEVGALIWNANGSLKQLAITDPFNSTDAQTCNYSHDDLSRIATVDCGATKWQQNFGYDAFGNIKKTVPVGGTGNSFQPTYDSASNRYASIPGTTVSYDNNGNVTNDGLHTYAWDADGGPTTMDTVAATYDALDRIVEQNKSGTYTQLVYSPTGQRLAFMNGQSLSKAYVSLPGGGVAVYTSSGLNNYHHMDWLGSFRLASSPTRTVIANIAYAPFGENYAVTGTATSAFTGMTQDTDANLYDFPAREYGTQGRWPSPDPAGLAAVDISNPQSWNRYAYVFNNPLALVDPLGFEPQLFCQSWSLSYEGIDLGSGMDCFMYDFSPRQYPLTLTPQQLAALVPLPQLKGQPDKVFSAANDARLAELIKKLQSCQQYSQIGDELAQMLKQGQITIDPKQGDYGWYHPWSDRVTLSADAMQNEPLTPIHEVGHRHQTSNVGAKWWRPLGAFNMQIGAAWGGLDKLWDQYVAGKPLSQGFVENAAQDWAIRIANACGIKP